jgi:hydrogenase-4 membrane subunit HyfE
VTPDYVVIAAGAALIVDTRTWRVAIAYAILAGMTSVSTAPPATEGALPLALFVVSLFLKLLVAPIGILLFARRNPAARDLRPAFNLPVRLMVVLALAFTAHGVTRMPEFAAVPAIGMASYTILCGLAVLVIHRNLVAEVIGLLVLGSGVTLAGATIAPQLPQSVEFGATFDALVVTFIGLALVRAFLMHNPLLDIESLQRLRG